MPANNQNPMDYRPDRTGNASEDLFKKNVLDFIYELRGQISNIQIPKVPSFQQIASQLQLGGVAPINISGLPGAQQIFQGTHAQRLASYPAGQNPGALFFETDRTALYASNGVQWSLIEGISFGTFEARWSGLNSFDSGFLYIESSRNNFSSVTPFPSYRWSGSNWALLEGWFARNQTNIAQLTATLTAQDGGNNQLGARVVCLDFNHISAWNGTALVRAPEDSEHSDSFHDFGSAPTETGWQACDGSNTTFYNYNGTTANRTLPNIVGGGGNAAYALANNAYNATITLAAVPTLTMNSYTPGGTIGGSNTFTPSGAVTSSFVGDPLAAHSHDAPIGDTANFLGMYTLNINGTGNSYTAVSKVVSVSDSSTIASRLTSATSGGTPTGNVSSSFAGNSNTVNGSSFTFTGNAATLTGNITLPGDPVNHYQVLRYYRR